MSRTLGVGGRLGLVVTAVVAAHVAARWFMFYLFEPVSCWSPCLRQQSSWWVAYNTDDKGAVLLSHVFGVVAILVVVAICSLVSDLVKWIVRGPSTYVDPCQNPSCPCERHVRERQRQAAANAAMTAGVTAAVVTTVMNPPPSSF